MSISASGRLAHTAIWKLLAICGDCPLNMDTSDRSTVCPIQMTRIPLAASRAFIKASSVLSASDVAVSVCTSAAISVELASKRLRSNPPVPAVVVESVLSADVELLLCRVEELLLVAVEDDVSSLELVDVSPVGGVKEPSPVGGAMPPGNVDDVPLFVELREVVTDSVVVNVSVLLDTCVVAMYPVTNRTARAANIHCRCVGMALKKATGCNNRRLIWATMPPEDLLDAAIGIEKVLTCVAIHFLVSSNESSFLKATQNIFNFCSERVYFMCCSRLSFCTT